MGIYNKLMETHPQSLIFILAITCLILAACQPSAVIPEALVQTPMMPLAETPESTPSLVMTPQATQLAGKPLAEVRFADASPFCTPEPDASSFILSCSDENLTISQRDTRRKVDIFTTREIPITSDTFSLAVEVESYAAQKAKSDQNSYGFYLIDAYNQRHALRITTQFFNFETWSQDKTFKIENKTNPAFSPAIKSAGQKNQFHLDCSSAGCDFFANGSLAGRFAANIFSEITGVGIFAASTWNQKFGEVKFLNLQIHNLPNGQIDTQPYILEDALTSSSSTFSGTGLSGAFNNYLTDGFHFSAVIPYGYYAVKSGPALGDVSVSVTAKMLINPGVSGSRYAGVVCHSSLDGMVMAVIRADGTYIIFRDTPKQPFAVLAKRASDAILPGLAENKLRLDCTGNQIVFYINGTQVESLTDTRYGLHHGRAGLFTKAGGDPNPEAIVFSNFNITEVH